MRPARWLGMGSVLLLVSAGILTFRSSRQKIGSEANSTAADRLVQSPSASAHPSRSPSSLANASGSSPDALPRSVPIAAAHSLAREEPRIREALERDPSYRKAWEQYLSQLEAYDRAFQLAQQMRWQAPVRPDPPALKNPDPPAEQVGDPAVDPHPFPGFGPAREESDSD
jgi:hypothetical protein